jgi:hypothetical protein
MELQCLVYPMEFAHRPYPMEWLFAHAPRALFYVAFLGEADPAHLQ